ncbi:hypothetical protein J6590_064983 [Homalodisca vitripennis]|nr:hypothetical protein J6590_064983 [Homalodisca vitripennis]
MDFIRDRFPCRFLDTVCVTRVLYACKSLDVKVPTADSTPAFLLRLAVLIIWVTEKPTWTNLGQ